MEDGEEGGHSHSHSLSLSVYDGWLLSIDLNLKNPMPNPLIDRKSVV